MPAIHPVYTGSAKWNQTLLPTPQSPDGKKQKELVEQANQQMYKQNFELMVRNKILSTLRSLYPLTVTSVNTKEMSQRIIDVLVGELKFKQAFIHILDKEKKELELLAVYNSPELLEAEKLVSKLHDSWNVSVESTNNILIQAIEKRQRQQTLLLPDILVPCLPKEEAEKIQEKIDVHSFLIYPLFADHHLLGTLTVGLGKESNELSRTERETLEETMNLVSIAIDRARLYENLEDANARLRELDKLKDEFVSLASHELRTPMAAIRGSVSTVLEGYAGEITSQTREFLAAAYNENDRLIRLVNNLLNTSRIEAGRLSFTVSRLELPIIINEVVKNLQMAAKEKNLYLIYEPFGFLPQIQGDEDKLKEVIINLIGNGIKFTSQGGLTIRTVVEGNFVKTSVADTGTGIHKEDFDLLFKKFSQVKRDQKYTKSYGGTGLGLYLSQKIIEGLGGKIWLESEVGKGTTFLFTLPIAK